MNSRDNPANLSDIRMSFEKMEICCHNMRPYSEDVIIITQFIVAQEIQFVYPLVQIN